MTYPRIQLVDAPTATANVLFDFNDTTANPKREVTADDFSIGTPELEGDIDAVDPLYTERMVSFTCAMTGTKPAVAASQSALARRLLAPGRGWLLVRLTPTSRLLFFRTYRPEPGDLSFDLVQSASSSTVERWELKIDIPCEPFAYGEVVTQSVQTVSNDPAGVTNPCLIALPAIIGDAPTRLRIQVGGASVDQVGYRHMFSLSSAASARPPILIPIGSGDVALTENDTGSPTPDSAYSGGSYRSTTFATVSAQARRLSMTTPAMLPGAYKVLVRVARPKAAATRFNLSAGFGEGVPNSIVTTNATDTGSGFVATWVDLGTLSHQVRSDPSTPVARPNSLSLYAGRSGGTGSGDLRWDAVLLIPVSTTDSVRSQTIFGGYTGGAYANSGGASGSNVNTFDGESESFWSTFGAASCELTGVFPEALPGNAHVLTVLTHVNPKFNTTFPADVITTTIQVTVSYPPRFLYIGES